MVVWFGGPGHESAGKLAAWLSLQGLNARAICKRKFLPPPNNQELMVVWGRRLKEPRPTVLNSKAPMGNKLLELGTLLGAGVPVPGISPYKNVGWLPRKSQHHDGDDLAQQTGDFYVEPIPTTYEFRVNVFGGKVVRTGLKIPKPGATQTTLQTPVGPIPIRTGGGGWTWTYSQAPLDATNTNRGPLREIAVKAVKTLGYDFGAVDVGYRGNGQWVVFEVNSAPALEGDDLGRYGELIMNYAQEKGALL